MSWPLLGWYLCRRCHVFNLSVWHASVCFCASLYKLLQEFHQSYNSGAVGDGDELIGFLWGQRSRSWREQIWTKVLILNHFVAVLRYVIITLVGLDVLLVILQFLPECGYVTFGSLLSQSVCRLSNVRAPYWGSWKLQQYFYTILYLSHSCQILRRSSRGPPLLYSLNARVVAK